MATTAPILKRDTDYSEYSEAEIGSVFKYDEPTVQLEEVTRKFLAEGVYVSPINPGMRLFTVYGQSHCVVVTNTNLVETP